MDIMNPQNNKDEFSVLLDKDTRKIEKKKNEAVMWDGLLARRALAEFIGTFIVVLFITGGETVDDLVHGDETTPSREIKTSFISGFIVFASVFIFGPVSGAHLSPATTFGYALRGVFPWRLLPVYFISQFFGGLSASLLLRLLFHNQGDLGPTIPLEGHYGGAMAIEIITSAVVMLVTFVEAKNGKIEGLTAAMAVGLTVTAGVLVAGSLSGGSMNPVESLAPALVMAMISPRSQKPLHTVWIYVVAPFVGSIFAAGIMWVIAPTRAPDEADEAVGSGKM